MYAKMISVRASASKSLIAMDNFACGFFDNDRQRNMVFSTNALDEWGNIIPLFGTVQGLEVTRHNRNIGYEGGEQWPDVTDFEIEAARAEGGNW